MKAVALKTFRDKHTGAVFAPGEVLSLDRERFSEIREKLGDSYIAEIADPEAVPVQEEPDSSGEVPADVDPAPPDPPLKKGKKKE